MKHNYMKHNYIEHNYMKHTHHYGFCVTSLKMRCWLSNSRLNDFLSDVMMALDIWLWLSCRFSRKKSNQQQLDVFLKDINDLSEYQYVLKYLD